MKILITGGNGFIARSLFEGLKEKYSIESFNRKELDLLDSDRVFKYLRNNNFDIIIHTANYDAAHPFTTKDPKNVLQNNLTMFYNIVRCKDYFGKMIYFGSGAEFSRENWIPRMKENYFDQHVPIDQYGFSKYIMTKYTASHDNIYNIRLFGVFGKYDDWRYRFIPNACVRAVLDLPITINQNVFFDYLYIGDLIKIVEWFIMNQPHKNIYNACTGKVYDLKTLAEKILMILGKNLEIKIKKDGLGREYSGDNSMLLKELNGFKFMSIDESIKILLDWYSDNKKLMIESDWRRFLL